MGETGRGGRRWEEDIYWNHFKTIHFSQRLLGDFHRQLAIPQKFADNLKKKVLPGILTIKGPSGATWNVGLITNEDTLFFKHGWQEFVKDHSLEENDILMFRYNGESSFDVLVFDGQSFCEKEASYFVRSRAPTNHDSGCQAERKVTKRSVEAMHNSSHDHIGCPLEKSDSDDDSFIMPFRQHATSPGHTKHDSGCQTEGELEESSVQVIPNSSHDHVSCTLSAESLGDESFMPSRWRALSQATNGKIQRGAPVKPIQTKWNLRVRKPSICAGVKAKPDAEHTSRNRNGAYKYIEYISNRRSVTEDEKKNAIQLACAAAAASESSFIIVVRPSHVYKRFYMRIPLEWVSKHLTPENQDVILCIKEKTWVTKYNHDKAHGGGGLTGGWKNFVLENNLEESDVCVFDLDSRSSFAIILDVDIFRVVKKVIPPTKVQ